MLKSESHLKDLLSVAQDVVRNEIQVMNQLNHSNLIQLYAAFESRHDIILVME